MVDWGRKLYSMTCLFGCIDKSLYPSRNMRDSCTDADWDLEALP